MKAAARTEVYYRAAYIMNAVDRIAADLDEGQSLREAIRAERHIFTQHQAARRGRLKAVARAHIAAARFGPLLGWYIDPMLNNEAECIAANGHNFYADLGTVIGYPGAVHPHCGCVAGPPHAGAGLVDDALVKAPDVAFERPRKVPLRRRVA